MFEKIEEVCIVYIDDNIIGSLPRNRVRKERKIHRGTYIYICD